MGESVALLVPLAVALLLAILHAQSVRRENRELVQTGQYVDWAEAGRLLAGNATRYVMFDFVEPGGRVWIVPEGEIDQAVTLSPDGLRAIGATATSVPLWDRLTGGLSRRLPADQYRRLRIVVRGPRRSSVASL